MSVFKLSNKIFELGLTAQEMAVYAYMCSLPSEYPMLDDAAAVKVKQSTIALKCGIKAVIISPLGTHQSATRKTAIRIKERTNPKQGTHQSAARNALPDEVISE